MPGTLFVVATPLGNLDDLTARSLATLRSVSLVLCEDTRRTAKLLARYDIDVPMLSYHRFNEKQRIESIVPKLRTGDDIALVSDGGTPGVSDPGAPLVRAVLDEGLAVTPLPGPSAVPTLLCASGLDAGRYVFEGFLPHRAGERRRRLRELRDEPRTVVFFEAPHRLLQTLKDIDEIMGDRRLVVGREMTKLHETILHGTAKELTRRLGDEVRGEITLALAGAVPGSDETADEARTRKILDCWHAAVKRHPDDRRAALREASRELGLKRADLYRLLSELGHEDPSPD